MCKLQRGYEQELVLNDMLVFDWLPRDLICEELVLCRKVLQER